MAGCKIWLIIERENSIIEKLQIKQLQEQPNNELIIQILNKTIITTPLQKVWRQFEFITI